MTGDEDDKDKAEQQEQQRKSPADKEQPAQPHQHGTDKEQSPGADDPNRYSRMPPLKDGDNAV